VRTPCRPLRMWSRCGVSTGWGGASGPLPANGAAVPAAGRVRRHLLAICLKGSVSVLMDGSGFSHGQRKRFSHCVSLFRSAATGGLGLWSLNIHGQLVATPWLGLRVAQTEGAAGLGVCLEDTGGAVIAHHPSALPTYRLTPRSSPSVSPPRSCRHGPWCRPSGLRACRRSAPWGTAGVCIGQVCRSVRRAAGGMAAEGCWSLRALVGGAAAVTSRMASTTPLSSGLFSPPATHPVTPSASGRRHPGDGRPPGRRRGRGGGPWPGANRPA